MTRNHALRAHLRRTRQTPAMRLTDEINRLATPENAALYAAVPTDKWVFVADLIGLGATASHLLAIQRLENKLDKLNKGSNR